MEQLGARLVDDDPDVAELLAISWEPAVFLIDRGGTIRARADAVVGDEELRSLFSSIA